METISLTPIDYVRLILIAYEKCPESVFYKHKMPLLIIKNIIKWLPKHLKSGQGMNIYVDWVQNEKSTAKVIKNLIFQMGNIPTFMLFAPEHTATHFRGIIPEALTFSELAVDALERVVERQRAITRVYDNKVSLSNLALLYKRIRSDKYDSLIKAYTTERGLSNLRNIYKKIISKNKQYLESQDLNERERLCLKYIGLNPRLCIINFFATELYRLDIRKLLIYQTRSLNITSIFVGNVEWTRSDPLKFNNKYLIFQYRKGICRKKHGPFKDFMEEFIKNNPIVGKYYIYNQYGYNKKAYEFVLPSSSEIRQIGFRSVWEYCDNITASEEERFADNPFAKKFMNL